jgi:hypothetical protein
MQNTRCLGICDVNSYVPMLVVLFHIVIDPDNFLVFSSSLIIRRLISASSSFNHVSFSYTAIVSYFDFLARF